MEIFFFFSPAPLPLAAAFPAPGKGGSLTLCSDSLLSEGGGGGLAGRQPQF